MQLGLNLGVQFFFQSLVEVLEEVQPSADNKTSCGAFGVLWATIPDVSQQKKQLDINWPARKRFPNCGDQLHTAFPSHTI